MNHHDALLDAILADPGDDVVRLVYADWLEDYAATPEERGRAEFIRVQIGLAGRDAADRSRLLARERQLLAEYGRDWDRPVQDLVSSCTFRRGFIEEVLVEGRAFLTSADELFRRAPVRSLRLYWGFVSPAERGGSAPALAECRHLARLTDLDLAHNYLESLGVQALVVSPYLTGLTALNLSHNHIGERGLRALATSPLPGQLTHLNLSHNDIGPGGVRTLAECLERLAASPDGLRLHTLDLSGNPLRAAGLRVIASTPLLQRIVRL
jgi:uncharacterized protein (TIGR02996 family)